MSCLYLYADLYAHLNTGGVCESKGRGKRLQCGFGRVDWASPTGQKKTRSFRLLDSTLFRTQLYPGKYDKEASQGIGVQIKQ